MRAAQPAAIDIDLPHNFNSRIYQKDFFGAMQRDKYKRAICIWHRRSGKDKTFLNFVIGEMHLRRGTYYYFLPTYNQGKKIIWDGMDRDGFPFLDHFPDEIVARKNKTEMQITTNFGSIFQVVGTDNIDSIMGTNPVGCVFSEYALQSPLAWDFVRPILRENGGWAVFNFTPRGRNHGYDLYNKNKDNPSWFVQVLTVDDTLRPNGTPVITKAMIDEDRREGMSEDLIQQEYYCSFQAALPGAYFGKELAKAKKDGRVSKVPYEPGVPVDTWWDLGMDDSMSIWFTQDAGQEIHLLDYYENSGEGLAFYSKLIEGKATENGWRYGRHAAPHDIKVRELGTGKSRLETAREMGLKFEVTPRPLQKEDSIEAARALFKRCWFDSDLCSFGVDALASYRKDYDEVRRVFQLRPVHDWASHAADAFQTLAIAHDREGGTYDNYDEVFG